MPQGLSVTTDEETHITDISWLPPTLNKRYGSLLAYAINCTGAKTGDLLTIETENTTHRLQLEQHEVYQCCVAVVNQAGIGNPSCVLIRTHSGGTQ